LIDDVKDICLELEDDGFIVSHHLAHGAIGIASYDQVVNSSDTVMCLCINMAGPGNSTKDFKYSEVGEVVERLKDYLGFKFLTTKVRINNTWYMLSRNNYIQIMKDHYLENTRIDRFSVNYIEIFYKL
jgi:hypothetical protein